MIKVLLLSRPDCGSSNLVLPLEDTPKRYGSMFKALEYIQEELYNMSLGDSLQVTLSEMSAEEIDKLPDFDGF